MSPKVTFSKSEPYKSGWRGWCDFVDVFLDGQKIGVLYAYGDDHRKHMKYSFDNVLTSPLYQSEQPRSKYDLKIEAFGLRDAKTKLQTALDAFVATER